MDPLTYLAPIAYRLALLLCVIELAHEASKLRQELHAMDAKMNRIMEQSKRKEGQQ